MTDLPPVDGPPPLVTLDEVQRLISEAVGQVAAQVPDIAARTLDQPTKRLGTVQSWDRDSNIAQVTVDGDTANTPIANGTGLPFLPGQRVVIDFYPPSGVLVTGVLTLAGQTPVGALIWMESHDAPEGYLGPLDGSAFDAAAYPDLADYLGGAVLPDYTGRFPVAADADHPLAVQGGSRFLQQHIHPLDFDIVIPVVGSTAAEAAGYYNDRGDAGTLVQVASHPHAHDVNINVNQHIADGTELNDADVIFQEPEWVGLNVFIKF